MSRGLASGENLQQEVIEFCKHLGIEYVGFVSAEDDRELLAHLKAEVAAGRYNEFAEDDLMLRSSPRQTMPEARSLIVMLFPYYCGEKPGANLARYAWSRDYHSLVREKLRQVDEFCRQCQADFTSLSFVDTGPLSDRRQAYLAGLGVCGSNGSLINETYGSYVVIGYLLTNYNFTPSQPLAGSCKQCGACQRCCPAGAIHGAGKVDGTACRSYLTQKKGELTAAELAVMAADPLVFGCDICQEVCPHNRNLPVTPLAEFRQNLISYLDEQDVRELSNKEFLRRYGDRAFSWRGKKILVRNAGCSRR